MFDRTCRSFPTPKIVEIIQEMFSEIKSVKPQHSDDYNIDQLEKIDEEHFVPVEEIFQSEEVIQEIENVEKFEIVEDVEIMQPEIAKPQIVEKIEPFLDQKSFSKEDSFEDYPVADVKEIDQSETQIEPNLSDTEVEVDHQLKSEEPEDAAQEVTMSLKPEILEKLGQFLKKTFVKPDNVKVKPNQFDLVNSGEDNGHPPKTCPPCASVSSSTVTSCQSNLETRPVITAGALAKLPVVLSQFQVQINITADISLPQAALEIKEILNSTKITQSLLLQEPAVVNETGNLFLKGIIRKNIAYATPGCSNEKGICGDLRHCTVDVPFECTTSVAFDTLPIPPVANSVAEFQFSRKQDLPNSRFAEKDDLLAADMSEYNQVSVEYFNELPYCELVSSRIVQYDEFLNRKELKQQAPFEERTFNHIEEKIVLFLTIRLLQNQLVQIPPTSGSSVLNTLDNSPGTDFEPSGLIELKDSRVAPLENSLIEDPSLIIEEDLEDIEEVEDRKEVITTDEDVGVVNYNKLNQAVAHFIEQQEHQEEEQEPVD